MYHRVDPSSGLLALAELQEGVVSLEQAHGHGLGRNSIARLVREGRWSTVGRGIYHTAPGRPGWRGLAWAGVLVGGDDSRVGGSAAAHLHGLTDHPPAVVDIWVPRKLRDGDPWRFRRETSDVHSPRSVGGPPCLTVEDTVLDLAAELDEGPLVALLLTTVQTRRSTATRLREAAAGRRLLARRRLVADVLAEAEEGVESPLERAYLHLVERAHGLPRGRRNRPQPGLRRDVDYERYGLLVELDGRSHEGAGRHRDMRRDNRAAQSRRPTLRFGWLDVHGDPCLAAAQVAELLVAGGWPGLPTPCPRCRLLPDLAHLAA
ncbi:type IV toxin-antitoxin system AbiEi family antitoxin domain-containing protein [Desertihabitans brevis]|nr:type IV toxin-antitoxin system AbiEi family antitoxin domain-containing protein [Desertihabitans brevis]